MIIAISGKARSGKGEFAKIAQEKHNATIVSFAAALKEEVADFLTRYQIPFRMENIYGSNEDKEEEFNPVIFMINDIPEFKGFIEKFCRIDEDQLFKGTFRSLLQWWGTEYRRAQDDLYWVKKAIAKCNPQSVTEYPEMMYCGHKLVTEGRTTEYLYVIDDLRFENEATALLKAGAVLLRVERPNNPNQVSNPNHPSEVGLDEWLEWRYVIENSGTVEEYHESCSFVLEDILYGNRSNL